MERSSGSNNIPSESSGQIDSTVIYMDRNLFDAAVFGDMKPLNPHINHLDRLVDGNQNTALHIYLAYGRILNLDNGRTLTLDHVQQLLEKCPGLLRQKNDRGEIPLHIAAKRGEDDIVQLLIECSKEQDGGDLEHMLRMKDKDDNTALHTAAFQDLNMAQLLLKEDPDLIYSVNKNRETPLYLAARQIGSGWDDFAANWADHCKPTAVGPHGRTILHAAILAKNEGMIKKILDRKKQLARERDEDGRTPLHYAAYIGSLSAAKMLLKCDAGAACLTDNKRRMSPLHMASWQGKSDVMKAIISSCPGCIGIVDNKGWNFLYYAFITRPSHEEYLLDILEFKEIPSWLSLTMFDLLYHYDEKDGITVMDVLRYCTSLHPTDDRFDWKFWRFWEQPPLPFWDIGLPLPQEKIETIKAVLKEINNNAQVAGLPPADHDLRNMEVKDSHNKKMREVIRETHLLVVTLVATVTFAAGLNLPGSYDDKEGTAILKNSAFRSFVIADVLAFVSSLSAVFIHLYIVFFRSEQYLSKLIRQGEVLTLFATVMMVIAFSTGLYATLSESSPWLAIASCCIANAFFLIVAYFYLVIKNKRPHDEKLAQWSDKMTRRIPSEMENKRK